MEQLFGGSLSGLLGLRLDLLLGLLLGGSGALAGAQLAGGGGLQGSPTQTQTLLREKNIVLVAK